MDSLLGRHRNLIILLGVLFLQALGLAVQVKKAGPDAENTRLIRIWGVGAITPVERAVVWMQNGVGNIWHNYFYLRGVRAENRELKEQIEQMRIEQVRLSEDAAQARRLQTLLAFKEQFISKTVAAQVIGSSGSDLSRVVYIDKGADAGLKRDMAVMTADGIVGKVILVYPSVSQVLLINDQTSGVGVILEKARLQGVLRGTANGEVVLERVMSDEQVPVGETVLTSGGDQIFPKGLTVGSVAKVSNGKDLFLNIKIKPATNLSKLEEVLVVVEKQERQPVAEDGTRIRAADILAQRLPSVPDKPPADANAVVGATTGPAKPGTTDSGTKSTGTKPAAAQPAGTQTPGQTRDANTSVQPVKNSTATPHVAANQAEGTADPTSAAPKTSPASHPPSTVVKPSTDQSQPEAPSTKPGPSDQSPSQPSSPQPSLQQSNSQPRSQPTTDENRPQ
jgi:rod shape-determining protein MreC